MCYSRVCFTSACVLYVCFSHVCVSCACAIRDGVQAVGRAVVIKNTYLFTYLLIGIMLQTSQYAVSIYLTIMIYRFV